jgi:hypothetical protein
LVVQTDHQDNSLPAGQDQTGESGHVQIAQQHRPPAVDQ